MRLINVHTLELEEFHDENGAEYTILSHKWEDGEVSQRDIQDLEVAKRRKGYAKILKSCEHAKTDGCSYVWVDTCCINKESSAELSEAINSMYRWYASSKICYAFLSDVQADKPDSSVEQQLKESLWFTCGWTLQELLAPQYVHLFDRQWNCLGEKRDLQDILTFCTGIQGSVIQYREHMFTRSIAERMSWASKRVTTRVEDVAYCLMGIFAVNMPLLYGEGGKAFLRLQEEIIKQTDDHSIFAWPMPSNLLGTGLLADSPAAFRRVRNVPHPRVIWPGTTSRAKPHTMTNRGLSIRFMALHNTTDTYFVRLNCADDELAKDNRLYASPPTDYLGILMRRTNEDDQ